MGWGGRGGGKRGRDGCARTKWREIGETRRWGGGEGRGERRLVELHAAGGKNKKSQNNFFFLN